MRDQMQEIVKRQSICVLATSHNDQPHCSLMAYSVSDDGREIYMVTSAQSRKYANLKANPLVSLLIDTRLDQARNEIRALTVRGHFAPVAEPAAQREIQQRLLSRHPRLAVFFHSDQARILRIRIASYLLLDGLQEAHFETL